MNKLIFIFISCLILSVLTGTMVFSQEEGKSRFLMELSLGPKIPLGNTKDDITTGLTINAGAGYKLTNYFELFHFAIDFGNSSPHNPNMTIIQDYYTYYGRLIMETVSIIGLPLTTRLHFPVKQNIDAFIGGGGAYYWFSNRLEDPIYGHLRKPRKRRGYGTVFEGGLTTNFFSERWIIMLKGDLAILETNGNSMSIKTEKDIESESKRTDKYLTISLGIRYCFD